MQLCIDVGNTRSKLGLAKAGEWVEHAIRDHQETEVLVYEWVAQHPIEVIGVVDVAGLTHRWFSEIQLPIVRLHSDTPIPITLEYETPGLLGADRIASAIGAKSLFPDVPALAINLGTCITYDLVTADSRHLGGSISPGLHMRLKAMNAFTAGLPHVSPEFSDDWIGRSTPTSLQTGAYRGMIYELNGYIEHAQEQFPELRTVISGGDAEIFAKALKYPIFADNFLVLRGLQRVLQEHIHQ